jgi:hypothetical protein
MMFRPIGGSRVVLTRQMGSGPMVVLVRRDGVTRQMRGGDLKDYLVRRFGVQQATKLYGYHQMLLLHGPHEVQRLLGPDRYVAALVMLREAGLDV